MISTMYIKTDLKIYLQKNIVGLVDYMKKNFVDYKSNVVNELTY